jgi:4-hydroxy-2-oxoheptanedioate aldolase
MPSLCIWLTHDTPSAAECLVAESNADFIIMDTQHGAFSIGKALELLARMKPLIPSSKSVSKVLVRLASPSNNEVEIQKYLDHGADGIIAPMIETVEHAQKLVEASLYPPLGKRSFGPIRQRLTLLSSQQQFSLEKANQSILILAMIETKQALLNIDSILATPHLSGIFIGPNDLAIAMGYPPSSKPSSGGEVQQTMYNLAQKAKSVGKIAGIFCSEPDVALDMIHHGYDLVVVTTDQRLLIRGAQNAIEYVKKSSKL